MEIIKNNISKIILLLFTIVGLSVSGMSQGVPGVYVYPEKNQSKNQQMKDEQNCYAWAQNEVSTNQTPMEKQKKHKTLKRTGIGAGAGAIIGGGKGAAIGAGAGAISGHRSTKKGQKEAAETISGDFKKAYSSCLKAKGYSVE